MGAPFGAGEPQWNPAISTTCQRHPQPPAAADDISSLAYNDGAYVAGTDDLSDIFASIITQLQQTAFNPVTDAMGEAATPLTYRDPIGRYMTVREVQGVELFGTTYPVTENADGTYSLPSREVVNPVYGTSFNLGDIKVSVDTGDDGTEELTCVLPADALPVRVETITVDGSGNQTDYTSTAGRWRPSRSGSTTPWASPTP